MKNVITSKPTRFVSDKRVFDNNAHDQLAEILKEQGYTVTTRKRERWGSGEYDAVHKINDIPVEIDGDTRSMMKIKAEGVYKTRHSDKPTEAIIVVDKNINLEKFKKNLDQVLLEYQQHQTQKKATADKKQIFEQLVAWADSAVFDFTIVPEDSSTYVQYNTLRIREKSDKRDYEVDKLTIDKQFQVIGTFLPYSSRSSGYISFVAADELAKHINAMKEVAAKAQPFLDALKNFVSIITADMVV